MGKKYGKTKIMQAISPNKSLEGCLASISFGPGICFVFKILQLIGYSFFPPMSLLDYLIFGFLITTFGMFGDMIESLVKRIGGW